jgi:hypothetical protein
VTQHIPSVEISTMLESFGVLHFRNRVSRASAKKKKNLLFLSYLNGVFGLWSHSMFHEVMHHKFISSILVESTHSSCIY